MTTLALSMPNVFDAGRYVIRNGEAFATEQDSVAIKEDCEPNTEAIRISS